MPLAIAIRPAVAVGVAFGSIEAIDDVAVGLALAALALGSGVFGGSVLRDGSGVFVGGAGVGAADAEAAGVRVGWGRCVASGRSTTTTSSAPAAVFAIATALCLVGEA